MSLLSTVAAGRLLIASDHAGYSLKQALIAFLAKQVPQLNVEDFGCNGEQDVVDYPNITEALCRAMQPEVQAQEEKEPVRAVLLCGSGVGVCIAANRFPWVRAVHAHDVHLARLSREHNNSNVLCMGARWVAPPLAEAITTTWLTTLFEERHTARVDQLGLLGLGQPATV